MTGHTHQRSRAAVVLAATFAVALFSAFLPAGAVAGTSAAATTMQAQPTQAPPDGFEPVTSVPVQEQLPAAPLVMIAYAFVWAAVLFYLWSLWRRLGAVERELADVTRRVGEGRRS